MPIGAAWRLHLGDTLHTLNLGLREPWPGNGPVDLTGHQSITVTVTRHADRVQLQQTTNVTVVDATDGRVSFDTDALVATLPGYCEVVATVVWPSGAVRSFLAGHLLIEGARPLTAITQPPLDLGDGFVIQVARWTPAGDSVIEVQLLGPDLVPTGEPTYLYDDPGDASDALVAWPGDPATLLDTQP